MFSFLMVQVNIILTLTYLSGILLYIHVSHVHTHIPTHNVHICTCTRASTHSYMTMFTSAAALLGQEIFVAGGQADKEVINSAEIYNPELNQWEQMVARMEVPRVGLAMVSMGNLIYAIGEEII